MDQLGITEKKGAQVYINTSAKRLIHVHVHKWTVAMAKEEI